MATRKRTIFCNIKSPRVNTGKRLFVILLSAIVAAFVSTAIATTDWQLLSDERKAEQFSASNDIQTISDSLHFTRKGKAVFFASQPTLLSGKDFNRTCGNDGDGVFTAGCHYYDYKNQERIEIYDVGTTIVDENGLTFDFGVLRNTVALHETMHAVWDRLDSRRQDGLCGNLKTLASQIASLDKETSIYPENSLCTELFARVGAEYASILSPNASVTMSTDTPFSYQMLDEAGKTAISNLLLTYNEYFDANENTTALAYWKNEKQLEAYGEELNAISSNLGAKKQATQAKISQYYSRPNQGRYYSAQSAISEYNSLLAAYNSRVATYNKVAVKLDNEHSLNSGSLPSL